MYTLQTSAIQACDNMMRLYPEAGIPVTNSAELRNMPELFTAAANTVHKLVQQGLELDESSTVDETAGTILSAFAADPQGTMDKITDSRLSGLGAATILQVKHLLDQFSHPVIENAMQIRNLVVNKLLIESDNPDPKIRLRALENLGKISDVSLFTEKTEITVTHQTTDDIRERLREKLNKLAQQKARDITGTAERVDD